MAYTVHRGDNLAILAELPDDSIDSIVTDSPYEIEVMGNAWDNSGVAYEVPRWREMRRVLKPGGYLINFAHARTYHRMACAVHDAGFEIRDQLLWIYGTGFPKSPCDITAAIDRNRQDDPRPVCRWLRQAVAEVGARVAELDDLFGHNGMAGHWCASDENTQPSVPTDDQWAQIVAWLYVRVAPAELAAFELESQDVGAEVSRLNSRKGTAGQAWQDRPIVGEHATPPAARVWAAGQGIGEAKRGELRDATPTTAAALPWIGWAANLRPSHEPAVLARKPFQGPLYANVLRHGVGALNVGGCRLPREDPAQGWPPNIMLGHLAQGDLGAELACYFYCDKASTEEREAGLDDFEPGARWNDGRKQKDKDYPSHRGAKDRRNPHTTVKPVDVMRWLCRMVTPPGGLVLDPYCGSGTTGIAATLEGFDFLGIDLDPDNAGHVEVARARIDAAEAGILYVDGNTDKTKIRGVNARKQGSLGL